MLPLEGPEITLFGPPGVRRLTLKQVVSVFGSKEIGIPLGLICRVFGEDQLRTYSGVQSRLDAFLNRLKLRRLRREFEVFSGYKGTSEYDKTAIIQMMVERFLRGGSFATQLRSEERMNLETFQISSLEFVFCGQSLPVEIVREILKYAEKSQSLLFGFGSACWSLYVVTLIAFGETLHLTKKNLHFVPSFVIRNAVNLSLSNVKSDLGLGRIRFGSMRSFDNFDRRDFVYVFKTVQKKTLQSIDVNFDRFPDFKSFMTEFARASKTGQFSSLRKLARSDVQAGKMDRMVVKGASLVGISHLERICPSISILEYIPTSCCGNLPRLTSIRFSVTEIQSPEVLRSFFQVNGGIVALGIFVEREGREDGLVDKFAAVMRIVKDSLPMLESFDFHIMRKSFEVELREPHPPLLQVECFNWTTLRSLELRFGIFVKLSVDDVIGRLPLTSLVVFKSMHRLSDDSVRTLSSISTLKEISISTCWTAPMQTLSLLFRCDKGSILMSRPMYISLGFSSGSRLLTLRNGGKFEKTEGFRTPDIDDLVRCVAENFEVVRAIRVVGRGVEGLLPFEIRENYFFQSYPLSERSNQTFRGCEEDLAEGRISSYYVRS